jgi:UDP-N-acetylglucosamine--N-acetylmuramyl-(pentapeptide) pyrophosphoryl-undecaprenol N-acetylglucosamine transferase
VRVVIAGGGSGGHLFPGVALAEELVRKEKALVTFVGTEKGIESRVIPRAGYQIKYLPVEGVMGRSIFGKIKALFKMAASFVESRRLLFSACPDIVIGTGGYASVSTVIMAWVMSIPTLILEQNVVPGAANKVLGKFFASAVAATYQESMSSFPQDRTYLAGNPVRADILRAGKESSLELFGLAPDRFTVFIFGGSSGARSINNATVSALNHLLDTKDKVQFLHQSGEQDYNGVREAYRKRGFRAMVAPFIFQMPEAYAVADLVVSRAGATTLAELTALGMPAILIPYPFAGEHQEFNARKLSELGAARFIKDAELSGETLSAEVRRLMESEEERTLMSRRSKSIGKPDAAQRVADIALSLIKLRKKKNV